jgi:hypothetical protein
MKMFNASRGVDVMAAARIETAAASDADDGPWTLESLARCF